MTIILAILESRIVEVVIGAALAVGFAILVEILRRPSLTSSIEIAPIDVPYPNIGIMRTVRIIVFGKTLRKGFRWMMRAPASQCRAMITFHHLDGQNLSGRAMPARWSNSEQPLQIVSSTPQGQPMVLINPDKVGRVSRIDIYPGESEPLDVAVRIGGDQNCYGWNNNSYLHQYRNPEWEIPPGRYLVKVAITSSGQTWTDVFRLVNDVRQTDFRLEPATIEDRHREGLAL